MKRWTALSIDVSSQPYDPGQERWYNKHTEYARESLTEGPLSYEDPSGLFGGICVSDISDGELTLTYKGRKIHLGTFYSFAEIDSGGLDYTRFELSAHLTVVEVPGEEEEEDDDEEIEYDEDDGRYDAWA